ncbi:hypothetical protein GJAV_G00070510 [Gymnothorax javanicus]|nr:hypothetical protein GJAV_G00070510 [Gymnothorax javanicus]
MATCTRPACHLGDLCSHPLIPPLCKECTGLCMTTLRRTTTKCLSGMVMSSSTLSPSTRAGCSGRCREQEDPACFPPTMWRV